MPRGVAFLAFRFRGWEGRGDFSGLGGWGGKVEGWILKKMQGQGGRRVKGARERARSPKPAVSFTDGSRRLKKEQLLYKIVTKRKLSDTFIFSASKRLKCKLFAATTGKSCTVATPAPPSSVAPRIPLAPDSNPKLTPPLTTR